MFISWLILIVLAFLILVSILDIKYKEVPSVLLTGLLFVVAVMRIENLQFGVLAGLFGWLMKDLIYEWNGLDFGLADIKIIAIMGLMLSTMNWFLILIGIFSLFQFVYTLIFKWRFKHIKEMPFIPVLLAVYISLMLVGGLA